MQPPILPITTSSNSNGPTSILPFLDVTKSLIGVCFSSLLTVFTFMKQNHIATGSTPAWSFSVLCVALSFAFQASVCEVLIRTWFPSAAGAMERVALLSIVTAFFMLMVFILPEDLGWFLLIPFLLVLVPFLDSILGGIIIKYHASPTKRTTTDEESTLPREAVAAERVIYLAPIPPCPSPSTPPRSREGAPPSPRSDHRFEEGDHLFDRQILSPSPDCLQLSIYSLALQSPPRSRKGASPSPRSDHRFEEGDHRFERQILSPSPDRAALHHWRREKKPKIGSTCNIGSQTLPPSSVPQPASQPNCLPPPLSRNLQRNQAASL